MRECEGLELAKVEESDTCLGVKIPADLVEAWLKFTGVGAMPSKHTKSGGASESVVFHWDCFQDTVPFRSMISSYMEMMKDMYQKVSGTPLIDEQGVVKLAPGTRRSWKGLVVRTPAYFWLNTAKADSYTGIVYSTFAEVAPTQKMAMGNS